MKANSTLEDVATSFPGATRGSPYLVPEAAATLLGVSIATLAKWREAGTGPAYLGYKRRVLYPKKHIAAYLKKVGATSGEAPVSSVNWAAPEARLPLATKEQILSGSAALPPIICGIYFLISDGEVQYVGQSVNVLSRVLHHRRLGQRPFDGFSFIEAKEEHLDVLERQYIHMLMPKGNNCGFTKRLREISRFSDAKD